MNLLRRYRLDLILFVCLFALMGHFKWKQHRNFGIHDYDTGIYSNVAWNIAHGNGFYSAINQGNQMGEHFSPIMAVFAPLYRLRATPLNILLPQAAAVALAIVLLYEIALLLSERLPQSERRIFVIASTSMALFYLPLMNGLMFEFHPSTLGMPLVAGAILCMHRNKMPVFWLLVALLLTTKEVAMLSVVSLGLYAGLVLRRRGLMIALFVVAGATAALVFGYIMPKFRDAQTWGHVSRLGIFALPGKKAIYVLLLFACLGFTPLFGGRALWAVLPTTLLNMSVSIDNQISLRFHYDDQNSIFWIVAGMYGLASMFARVRTAPHFAGRTRQAHWALAALVIAVSFSGGGTKYIRHVGYLKDMRVKKKLRGYVAKYAAMPAEIPIAAQAGIGPYVCHRTRFVHINRGYVKNKPYQPGDYLMLSPLVEAEEVNVKKTIRNMRNDPRLKLIETHKELTVFQVK